MLHVGFFFDFSLFTTVCLHFLHFRMSRVSTFQIYIFSKKKNDNFLFQKKFSNMFGHFLHFFHDCI